MWVATGGRGRGRQVEVTRASSTPERGSSEWQGEGQVAGSSKRTGHKMACWRGTQSIRGGRSSRWKSPSKDCWERPSWCS